jgi:hypothetical protein
LQHALEKTVSWHQAWIQGQDMNAVSLSQIQAYEIAGHE